VEKIFKNCQCIFTLLLLNVNVSPVGEDQVALYMDSSEFPLPKDDVCQLWPSGSGEVENVKV
jgi:hypothetical protein